MKTILCYGDSNTWGYRPGVGERFSLRERWTGVLARELNAGYRVIEEGLNGRTTAFDDPVFEHRNGRDYLAPCLQSHAPLDLVVVMLGTNDLARRLCLSASDIAQGAGTLVDTVNKSGAGPGGAAPKVLLIAPPPVGQIVGLPEVMEGAEGKSKRFPDALGYVAQHYDCSFLDASEIVVPSEVDGVHLDAPEHLKLGAAVANLVRQIVV